MPERTRERILAALAKERAQLVKTIQDLPGRVFIQPGVVEDWSVKDVLAHLAHWEVGMLRWVEEARKGSDVTGPDEGLKWSQMKEFNQRIFDAHKDEPLDKVIDYFHETHTRFMKMAAKIPEGELLTNNYYPFTENKAIYDWLSQYAAHDRWGRKKIEEWLKAKD